MGTTRSLHFIGLLNIFVNCLCLFSTSSLLTKRRLQTFTSKFTFLLKRLEPQRVDGLNDFNRGK